MRAEDILAAYSLNSLRTMARLRAITPPSRRPELLAALAERLFDADALRTVLARLVPGELAALRVVIDAGGRLARHALAQALLEQGLIDDLGTGRPRETVDRIPPTTRHFDELCARLTAYALLFSEPEQIGPVAAPLDLTPGAVLFVPGPIQDALRQAQAVPPQPSAGRLIVQPSFTLLLLPPLDAPTLERLQAIAEPVRIAEAAEFRLTQATAYAAAQRGESPATIMAFLEQRSGAPLPQNVRYTLGAWERAFGQIRFHTQALVVDGPPALLDRLAADALLAPLVLRRLAPERLLLRDAATVRQRLAELDEIPALQRYDVVGAPVCQIDAEGLLTPHSDDLLLPLRLQRIAEPLADGRYRLTPQRVRAAVAAAPDGLTGVLKSLRALAGELPEALVARLRLWALPPDAVRLEQPLLLDVPPDVLSELRTDPALAALLGEVYQPRGVALRVAPEQREQLLAALAARGIMPVNAPVPAASPDGTSPPSAVSTTESFGPSTT